MVTNGEVKTNSGGSTMGILAKFSVFICSVVWAVIGAMVVWSAYPQTIRDVTLISQSGEVIEIAEAKYSRLFRTITYTDNGTEITLDAEQYRMEKK